MDCPPNGEPCTVQIELDRDIPAPIYFNYKLENFYQGHRVYLNSRSDDQLKGSVLNTKGCNPSRNLNGVTIYPCGLLPQSIFTDRFFIDIERNGTIEPLCPSESCPRHEDDISWDNYWNLFETNGTWERTGTWGGLADSKYQVPDEFPSSELYTRNSTFLSGTNLQLPNPDNSDLIVWMRTAVTPNFKKPFRVIKNYDLLEGDIVHVFFYQYFDLGEKGRKYFVLETSPGFGPSTVFLGALCLVIGVCTFCMFSFVLSGFGHHSLLNDQL